jgi:hypothetical protein
MSWLPAMMFMRMLDDDELDQPKQGQDPEEQYPTRCNAGYTPVVTEICPPVTDNTPATANNSTQRTPTVATRTWHHTAMSAATFTLSALLAYVATEAIFKRIRGRN